MNNSLRIVLITIASFGVYYTIRKLFFLDLRSEINSYINQLGISHLITYLIVIIPLIFGVGLIHNFNTLFKAIGLEKSFIKAFLFALVCTLPMLIGYSFLFDFKSEVTFNQILIGAVMAALMEEIVYRGILFGQVFRYTKVGFILSISFGALLFALSHLYQSQELIPLIGIFLTTFLGAILFAWIYVEWNNNLWVAIFLHLFMNLFWMLFSVSDNALGGIYANIFRVVTIVLIIGLTIGYKLKKGIPLKINKSTLFIKKYANVSI